MSYVKNLYPKFNNASVIPTKIKDVMGIILEKPIKIPNYMGDNNSNVIKQLSSYNNNKYIAEYEYVNQTNLNKYFDSYESNKKLWESTPFNQKKDVFLKAADLIENKYYDTMLAYTILSQNKTVYEAEIDAICELVDFIKFNVSYAERILKKQPVNTHTHIMKNISEYNSLNGFVTAITPFNFTAIAGNLASAPLLFGNSVLWKPSDSAILSNYLFYEIMLEAGLPEGVLNFCPMEPNNFLNNIVKQEDLAGILFTGSSSVFDDIYTKIGTNIKNFKNYPRIIGETGGKNFHFVDKFNDLDFVVKKTMESAFNFSGQKCSACSIMYVPSELLDETLLIFSNEIESYKKNNSNYGVINRNSYDKLDKLLNELKEDDNIHFLFDNNNNNENSYYIEPNVLVCKNHSHKVFNEEFFGPIIAIYPYDNLEETINLCKYSNNYALTGSIFSNNSKFIENMSNELKCKTGNFYINDKSTGSVVGHQPFGGSGKSGTNDKAGDMNMLYRLFNQRNIKISLDV